MKHFYDIKGNTFKNTLVPKETAKTRFLSPVSRFTMPDISLNKVKPTIKERDMKSGTMLFNNIYQTSTDVHVTPRNQTRTIETLGPHEQSSSSLNKIAEGIINNTFQSPNKDHESSQALLSRSPSI